MTTTYAKSIEFGDEIQYDELDEVILRNKIKSLNNKLRHRKQAYIFMQKLFLGIIILVMAFLIAIVAQNAIIKSANSKYTDLRNQYDNLQSDYNQMSIDYATLKEEFEVIKTKNDIPLETVTDEDLQYLSEFTYNKNIPLSEDLQKYAFNKCKSQGIDYSVFLGLMRNESSFDPSAQSGTNDYGLCQINECNHEWMREVFGSDWDPMDPYDSIDASTFILRDLINSYGYTNYHSVLMGYNMGPTNTKKCFDNGIYSSRYSRAVMDYAIEYGYSGNGSI